jgi:hypothetical protein
MRTLMKFQVPVEAGNKAAVTGALEQALQKTLGELKPEAAYFYPENGMRGGIIVFDLKSPSDLPSIAVVHGIQCERSILSGDEHRGFAGRAEENSIARVERSSTALRRSRSLLPIDLLAL